MNGQCFKNWQHMSLHGEMLMILPLKKKMSFLKKTKKLANVEYAEELHKKHNELPFLAERMKAHFEPDSVTTITKTKNKN